LGSPIAHSRSPQLHLAAYRALGLRGWTYDRIECAAEQLPSLVSDFGPEWIGVSVTMPGKFAALRFADDRTARAELVGSANTLVRTAHGWLADNSDIDGVTGSLAAANSADWSPRSAVVVGSGGTAPAAIAGVAQLGVQEIIVAARSAEKAAPLLDLAGRSGMVGRWCDLDGEGLASAVAVADLMVSTIPAEAAAGYAQELAGIPVLLDAIYDPWPTPLASAVNAAGGRVISGLRMLLHQAFTQVELFTGRPAPKEAMSAALD
jgi:shikimate dehydrogenase